MGYYHAKDTGKSREKEILWKNLIWMPPDMVASQ